ncbi:MAG: DegV family protein [bacterium]|nr:DegV family protein [bacterium]
MQRPTLLIIDPDAERRFDLGQDLAAAGYEVVPAVDVDEGLRFTRGLASAVIVAPADLPQVADGSLFAASAEVADGEGHSIVLLGETAEEASRFPEDVIFLAAAGLTPQELMSRLRLVLIGREIGVEVDSRLETLVGDLALLPLLELLRSLGRVAMSGKVELERGTIYLDRGRVVAARAGAVTARKAVCRLGRLSKGHFRIRLGSPALSREIDEETDSLIVAVIEDSLGEFPHPRTRVRIEIGPSFFQAKISPIQQEIISAAQKGATLEQLLDVCAATDGRIVQELLRLTEQGIAVLEEPVPAVQVVTDSTADLPAHLVREHGIEIVPLTVHFGERVFRDGVELEPREFYQRLEEKKAHPSTNPPDPVEFAGCYRRHLGQRDLVSLHISSRLSDTVEHARHAAATELGVVERAGDHPACLEVVDSGSVSFGLGFLATFAARMAAHGLSAPVIAGHLKRMSERIHTLFVVDTLEYLVRGGRIGKARGWIGQLLGIKPILGLADGEVVPIDRVRGGRAAHPRIIELLGERLDPGRPVVAAVAHAKAPVWADRLRRLVADEFEVREFLIGEIGPVVGTHVGPGAVGVFVFQPTEEELALIAPLYSGVAG